MCFKVQSPVFDLGELNDKRQAVSIFKPPCVDTSAYASSPSFPIGCTVVRLKKRELLITVLGKHTTQGK